MVCNIMSVSCAISVSLSDVGSGGSLFLIRNSCIFFACLCFCVHICDVVFDGCCSVSAACPFWLLFPGVLLLLFVVQLVLALFLVSMNLFLVFFPCFFNFSHSTLCLEVYFSSWARLAKRGFCALFFYP